MLIVRQVDAHPSSPRQSPVGFYQRVEGRPIDDGVVVGRWPTQRCESLGGLPGRPPRSGHGGPREPAKCQRFSAGVERTDRQQSFLDDEVCVDEMCSDAPAPEVARESEEARGWLAGFGLRRVNENDGGVHACAALRVISLSFHFSLINSSVMR